MWLCLLAAVVAGADPVLIPQMGPRGGVTAASFSRDGRWLATGDGTGGIQVWEAETGAQSGALPGHTRDITSVDLSPDGVILVSASEDETVRIWDVAGGELMAELAVEDDSEGPVAFSPDGQYVAVAVGHGRRVTLWHAETGAAVRSFHSDGVWARELRFSADGGELLATGADGAVVWDTATAEQLRRLEADHFEFASAAMGGGELVAAGLERVIRLWDAETGLPGPPIRANGSHAAATSPGGNLVALGCPDGSILFADATSGEWLQQVPGHDRRVNAVAFSPDGRLLASGADDELVVIWDVTTGARRHELTGHKDEISALTFSPDGALLATATDSRDENAVIMWDVESGELVCRLPGCRDVGALAFDSDGARLAVGANRRLRMHDPVTGNLLWEIETHTDDVRAIAFTPDGRALASSDEDRVVLISSADSGALLGRFSVTNSYGRQLSFSEDGSVLSVGQHAILSVWDAQTGRSIRELELPGVSPLGFSGGAMLGASPRVVLQSAPGMVRPIGEPDSPPRGVRISPDGRWLAVAEAESDVRLCDVATGQTVQALEGRGTYGRAGFFSVDGRRVLTSGRDGAAIIWETGSGRRLYTLTGHSTIAMLALLSPDARFLATAHSDGGAHLWDLTAMRNVRMWGVKTAFRSPLTFSPDSRTLVLTRSVRTEPAGDQPASVRKYFVFTDVESGEVIRELEAPERMAGSATLSPDGGRLASAGSQGTVVWDLKTGEELFRLARDSVRYRLVTARGPGIATFSPDGRLLATAGVKPRANVWDAFTGERIAGFPGPEDDEGGFEADDVGALAFSPDGEQLACLRGYRVDLWDVATGALEARLEDGDGPMTDLAYTPDGQTLITSTERGLIVLWDLGTAQPRALLEGHWADVMRLSLAADGRLLASASREGTVRLWDVPRRKALATLWSIGLPRYRYEPPGGGSTFRRDASDLWAAWTPEGCYECSPGAEGYLWFRGDDGTMAPAAEYADRFQKPADLTAALAGG